MPKWFKSSHKTYKLPYDPREWMCYTLNKVVYDATFRLKNGESIPKINGKMAHSHFQKMIKNIHTNILMYFHVFYWRIFFNQKKTHAVSFEQTENKQNKTKINIIQFPFSSRIKIIACKKMSLDFHFSIVFSLIFHVCIFSPIIYTSMQSLYVICDTPITYHCLIVILAFVEYKTGATSFCFLSKNSCVKCILYSGYRLFPFPISVLFVFLFFPFFDIVCYVCIWVYGKDFFK